MPPGGRPRDRAGDRAPALIAHRGASAHAPENTVAAYDLALAQGADVLELDVRVTGDGELVTLHDPTLARTTGDPRRHDELVGRLDHPAAPVSLDTVLDRYGARTRYLVDLKDPEPSWEGRVVEALERRGLGRRAMVQSFDLDALGRLHRLAPWLAISALYRRAASVWLEVSSIPSFARAVGVWHPTVDAAFVRAAHARGIAVHPWTVDDPRRAARLAGLGVDGVITNAPATVADAISGSSARAAAA